MAALHSLESENDQMTGFGQLNVGSHAICHIQAEALRVSVWFASSLLWGAHESRDQDGAKMKLDRPESLRDYKALDL